MIYSRKDYQMQIVQYVLSPENNPTLWTEESLKENLKGEVVIGYILKNKQINATTVVPIINLYTINPDYLEYDSKNKIISAKTLSNAFLQWLESLAEDPKSILFRNPPIKEWLDTKENWAKKTAIILSKTYNKPMDECLSIVYYVIMVCYNNDNVYMGSLNYITTAAHNEIKKEFEFMRNRLTGSNPMAINLDASPSDFNGSLEDTVDSFHELIGKDDPFYEGMEFEQMRDLVMKDLRKEFSEREIDQIFSRPEYLPNSVYRKLLKWRKTHKLEDYK